MIPNISNARRTVRYTIAPVDAVVTADDAVYAFGGIPIEHPFILVYKDIVLQLVRSPAVIDMDAIGVYICIPNKCVIGHCHILTVPKQRKKIGMDNVITENIVAARIRIFCVRLDSAARCPFKLESFFR